MGSIFFIYHRNQMIIKLKVVYHLQPGQTSRFMVWANGKQTSGLVNLPFAEISSLYLK